MLRFQPITSVMENMKITAKQHEIFLCLCVRRNSHLETDLFQTFLTELNQVNYQVGYICVQQITHTGQIIMILTCIMVQHGLRTTGT